jgi:hypothetical protein
MKLNENCLLGHLRDHRCTSNQVNQGDIKQEPLLEKAAKEKDIIKQSSKEDFRLYDTAPANNARIVSEACDKFFRRRNIISRSAWLSPFNRKKTQQTKDEQRTKNN